MASIAKSWPRSMANRCNRLNQAGFIEGAYLVLASMHNMRRLMAEKQRRLRRAGRRGVRTRGMSDMVEVAGHIRVIEGCRPDALPLDDCWPRAARSSERASPATGAWCRPGLESTPAAMACLRGFDNGKPVQYSFGGPEVAGVRSTTAISPDSIARYGVAHWRGA
jgi:hypothetical protein